MRGALRMLTASAARSAQVMPARPPFPQGKAGIQREQKNHTRLLLNPKTTEKEVSYNLQLGPRDYR